MYVSSNKELKRCSCGGEAKIIKAGAGITERCYAICQNCFLRVPQHDYYLHDDEKSVIAAWNKLATT